MAGFPLINLPGYQAQNALNFSPLSNAIQSNQDNALAQRQMAMQEQRNALMVKQDDRAAQSHGFDMAARKRQQDVEEARQAAGRIQYIQGLPADQQPGAWQQTLQLPGFRDLPPDLRDFNRAAPVIMSKAAEYIGPQQRSQMDMQGAHADLYRAQAEKARREASGPGKTSLVPIYGVDGEGKPVVMQPSDSGRMVQSQMPPGVTISQKPIRVDAGTHDVLIDPITRQPVATIPKDIAGKAAAAEAGKGAGQAQGDLPKVRQNAATTLKYIDDVLRDPNLGNVTGAQGWLPTVRASSRDTEARIAQLGGRAFLSAFESLKGGGQITEIEGKKATEALARLTDLKQSDAGYKKALEDFRNEVITLVRIAEQRAQGAGPYVPPAGEYSDGVPRQNTGRLQSTPGWSIKRID